MTELLLPLSWTLSTAFLMIYHPLALGAVLMVQATIVATTSALFNSSSWFSYILFLVMIGGMLVMFMYMTSVASNEKFHLPKQSSLMFMVSIPAIYVLAQESFIKNINIQDTCLNHFNIINLTKYYMFPLNQTLMFLMVYLLFVLIASVKIAKNKSSPFRKK